MYSQLEKRQKMTVDIYPNPDPGQYLDLQCLNGFQSSLQARSPKRNSS
jgi:hypothetical protein